MLKQHQPASQQDSDHPHSATLNPESTRCTDSSKSRDSMEALPGVWHAALDVQPAEASPAVQLSGCWTEARPGMPSAVTRSQLRAPAWRPAPSAAPAQLQSCAPSTVCSAAPHAASPSHKSSHSDQGLSGGEGDGQQAISIAPLESRTGMSPLAWRPKVAASQAELHCSRAPREREETPFFTPVAALPKPEPHNAPYGASAGTSRLGAAADSHSGFLQVDTPHVTVDGQSQSHAKASTDVSERSEHMLDPGSCGSSSSGAMSSRKGGSSHQQLEEDLSRQEDATLAGSDSAGPCKATHVDADPALSSSSSRDSWETDMAECGSPGAYLLSSSVGRLSALDSSGLQQTPPNEEAPQQALTPAASSIGECATPDFASHDPLPWAGDSVRWQALALGQDTESSCQANVQGRAWSPVQSPVDSSHASCCAAQLPADSSMQNPVQQALPLGPANNAHSSPAQPASAVQHSLRDAQNSSSHEDLMERSITHGSCPSARAGNWMSDSGFWEAPAWALPGQAMQSPQPCAQADDLETDSGKQAQHLNEQQLPQSSSWHLRTVKLAVTVAQEAVPLT